MSERVPSTGIGVTDVPDSKHGKYDWPAIAAAAKQVAPKWYQVFEEDSNGYVVSIRKASNTVVNESTGFRVVTRNNHPDARGKRVCALWIKYVPEQDTTNEKERSNS